MLRFASPVGTPLGGYDSCFAFFALAAYLQVSLQALNGQGLHLFLCSITMVNIFLQAHWEGFVSVYLQGSSAAIQLVVYK